MSITALKGGKELAAFLEAFPKRLKNGAIRAGLVAAAKPIRTQARQNARKRSGKMAKAIRTGSPRVNQDGTVSVRVYVDERKPHGFLGYFHEYGVDKHLISVSTQEKPFHINRHTRKPQVASMKLVNRMVKSGSLKVGQNFIGPIVQHPGHTAHPFLRPALDMREDDAIRAFGVRVQEYLKTKTGFTAPLLDLADD